MSTRLIPDDRGFDMCVRVTLDIEGPQSSDRDDGGNWSGGAVGRGIFVGTFWGISQAAYRNDDGRRGLRDALPPYWRDRFPTTVDRLQPEQIDAVYYHAFWRPLGLRDIPLPLAMTTFDAAVHSGGLRATTWLQIAVGANPDGILGPLTKRAAERAGLAKEALTAAVEAALTARLRFLASDSMWKRNGGWAARIVRLAMTVDRTIEVG